MELSDFGPKDVFLHRRAIEFSWLAINAVIGAAAQIRGDPRKLPILYGSHGWTRDMVKAAAEMAKPLKGVHWRDLAFGAVLAWRRGWLREPRTAVRNLADCLAMRTCTNIALKAFREWQSGRQPNDLPPVDYAGLSLAGHWEDQIKGENVAAIASELASAFPPGVLPLADAEALIRQYAGQALSAELGMSIAKEALERVAELRARSPLAPPAPQENETQTFGRLVHLEAERRGMRQAATVLVMGDGGNWIDPLSDRERLHDRRIVDYYHAAEHLHDAAPAALGRDTSESGELAGQLKDALWDGKLDQVIATLKMHADRLGAPQPNDGPDHPRRVLASNVGYFETHRHHMDYPTFRRKGWPIGSGVTESAVKQFNKRVKGTEQFWSLSGVESILSLRALWLSQDGRWERYWNTRPGYSKAA